MTLFFGKNIIICIKNVAKITSHQVKIEAALKDGAEVIIANIDSTNGVNLTPTIQKYLPIRCKIQRSSSRISCSSDFFVQYKIKIES